MRISALRATGYRNLDGQVGLCDPVAILVGENNAGKSNVIDALRSVLEPEMGPRGRHWLRIEDFTHDAQGTRVADQLDLEVELRDLSPGEQARLVTCLAPNSGPGVAKIRLNATIGADERIQTRWFGGDAQVPDVERHARSAVRFVYLHPLRDAANDLRPGRDNKLVGLISALAPAGHDDREAIVSAAQSANDALDGITAVQTARSRIATRLTGMTGGGRFAQQSGLAFDDPRFDRVISSLRAKIGHLSALEMDENGLGYNNLLYMAVLLSAISDRPTDEDPTLRVLLVEEPEAHLHPQLQDLLMKFLQTEAAAGTQVVVTTHSPNFASSARVEDLTVMARAHASAQTVARLPRDFGLEAKQLAYLRRFLDVTKASLFFARAVILVEGVAEQLLVPVFARRLNRPLSPNGVAVINIGGVAFPPFTDLFGADRLPYRLAVVSDADAQPDDTELDGEDTALSPRARLLDARAGDNITVALSSRTLEYDLAVAGNSDVMLQALREIKPRVAARLTGEAVNQTDDQLAAAVLAAVSDVKGRFAQELAERWADPAVPLQVPGYLEKAITWVADLVTADNPPFQPAHSPAGSAPA